MTNRMWSVFGVRFFATAIALLLSSSGWALNSYYVYDGRTLSEVRDDPSRITVDQWLLLYFKKGASTESMSAQWGMGLEKTPEAVLNSVEKNQKFERHFEKWCQCTWGSDTFFNVVAPVATVQKASDFNRHQLAILILSKAHGGWDRIQELVGRFNTAAELAGEQRLPKLGGGPFSEFMNAMHSSIDQALSINSQVTRYSGTAIDNFESQLDRFTQAADKVTSTATLALQTLQPDSTGTFSRTFRHYHMGANIFTNRTLSIGTDEITIEERWENNSRTLERKHIPLGQIGDVKAPRQSGNEWNVSVSCKSDTSCIKDEFYPDTVYANSPDYGDHGAPKSWDLLNFATQAEATSFYETVVRLAQPIAK